MTTPNEFDSLLCNPQAGMRILQQGGIAADAAVAMAAALNVSEPTSTGIGGDVFALFWDAAAKEMRRAVKHTTEAAIGILLPSGVRRAWDRISDPALLRTSTMRMPREHREGSYGSK